LDTVRGFYGRLRKFTWRFSRILDTVGGLLRTRFAVQRILRDVSGRLRGGFRAFWTPLEDFTDAFRRSEDFTRPLLTLTYVYVEDLAHFGHHRRTLLAHLAVWRILGRRRQNG